MIDRKHDLPVTRQCQLLGLNRLLGIDFESCCIFTVFQQPRNSKLWPKV